jgi:hypothetical protein
LNSELNMESEAVILLLALTYFLRAMRLRRSQRWSINNASKCASRGLEMAAQEDSYLDPLRSFKVVMASVIMSAETRQSRLQSKIQSSSQLYTMYATEKSHARSHRQAVLRRLELTLVAGVVRGGGLGLGCCGFGRHGDELMYCIE